MDNQNNYPVQGGGMPPEKNGAGFGVASMVLGIIAVLFSCCIYVVAFPLGILGLILGIVGIKKNSGKGMAIAGLVLNLIAVALGVACIVLGGAILASMGIGS